MYILNIIDTIYENSYFQTCLIGATIFLVLLFIVVLILGIKDSKKAKEPKVIIEEDLKDVTFNMPSEMENIKEDVTFEMPVLTKNLEDFKRNLEEEIQKEDEAVIRKTSGSREIKESKPVKILDAHEIEDTAIVHLKEIANHQEEKPTVEANKEDKISAKKSTETSNSKKTSEITIKPQKDIAKEASNENAKSNPLEMLLINPLNQEKSNNKNTLSNNKKSEDKKEDDINVIEKDSISDMYDSEDDF